MKWQKILGRIRRKLGSWNCGIAAALGMLLVCTGNAQGQDRAGAGSAAEARRSIFSASRTKPPRFPEASSDLGLPSFVPVDDDDLGTLMILEERDGYKPFAMSISSGLYYTDNAGLDPHNEIEDGYWWNSLGASYLPQIAGGLAGDFGLSYEMFRYESSGFLDFDEFEAGAGLMYVFRELADLSLYARYNYDRIVEPREYDEIFVQHGFVTGFYKPFLINRHHFFYARAIAEFGLDASPDYAKQNDYNLLLGYRLTPIDDFGIEPYYRLRYLDFENGREDLLHTFGLGLQFRVSKNWFAGASGYWTTNDSNHQFGDFEAGTIGGRIGFQTTF